MRREDLLGPGWSDVDLDAATVTVRRAFLVVNDQLAFAEAKTSASRRSISIDPGTVTTLRHHRARRSAERLRAGSA